MGLTRGFDREMILSRLKSTFKIVDRWKSRTYQYCGLVQRKLALEAILFNSFLQNILYFAMLTLVNE